MTRSEVAQHLADFDLARLYEGDPSGIDQRRLMLLQQSADSLSLGDSEVDFLISTSFLEHVADAPAVLAEMHRVMKPGAFMVHSIDGADHRLYDDASLHPLEFLSVDSDERIVFECNRLRPLEFTALYSAAGFDIVNVDLHDRVELDEAFLRRLAPRFRNLPLEQLQTLRATIHARKH